MSRPCDILAAVAALMGAGGVALGAISLHYNGGLDGDIASQYLLFHAAALAGVSANARASDATRSNWISLAGGALALGTLLFAADLATRGLAGARLFPLAAPAGGMVMILSWLALAVLFLLA